MRVRVLLFGVLKERLGATEHLVDLRGGTTVAAVMDWARDSLGNDGLVRSLAVAVNREYAGPEAPLREGDEVALLPPVSGGLW